MATLGRREIDEGCYDITLAWGAQARRVFLPDANLNNPTYAPRTSQIPCDDKDKDEDKDEDEDEDEDEDADGDSLS
ncbi:hypothetical protein Tco_0723861 [Tanacetum coccineum]